MKARTPRKEISLALKSGWLEAPRRIGLRHFVLPCPFCGGTRISWMKWCECRYGVMHNARQQDPRRVVFSVECACGAAGPVVRPSFVESGCRDGDCPLNAEWVHHAQAAYQAWNIRHPEPEPSELYALGCPFCGDAGGLTQAGPVLCSSCGAQGPELGNEEGDEKRGRFLWSGRAVLPRPYRLGWGNPPKSQWTKYDWPTPAKKPRKTAKVT